MKRLTFLKTTLLSATAALIGLPSCILPRRKQKQSVTEFLAERGVDVVWEPSRQLNSEFTKASFRHMAYLKHRELDVASYWVSWHTLDAGHGEFRDYALGRLRGMTLEFRKWRVTDLSQGTCWDDVVGLNVAPLTWETTHTITVPTDLRVA